MQHRRHTELDVFLSSRIVVLWFVVADRSRRVVWVNEGISSFPMSPPPLLFACMLLATLLSLSDVTRRAASWQRQHRYYYCLLHEGEAYKHRKEWHCCRYTERRDRPKPRMPRWIAISMQDWHRFMYTAALQIHKTSTILLNYLWKKMCYIPGIDYERGRRTEERVTLLQIHPHNLHHSSQLYFNPTLPIIQPKLLLYLSRHRTHQDDTRANSGTLYLHTKQTHDLHTIPTDHKYRNFSSKIINILHTHLE